MDSTTKPQTLPVQLDRTPASIKEQNRYVGWRWTFNSDKPGGHHHGWDKPLLNPKTGKLASSTEPESWSTYEEAVNFMHRNSLDGIGFNFLGYEGLVVHDLDNCRNPQTGEISPQAMNVVRLVGSYWEATPSGTGIRGLCWGQKTGPRVEASKGGPIDGAQYDGSKGRYVTLTGHTLPESTADICEAHPGGIEAAYALMFPEKQREPGPKTTPKSVDVDDLTLLDKARRAKNGAKFVSLWSGDTSDYRGDDSAADMALCCELAFWTGDAAQIDRLFRQSGLMRDKWDRTWGEGTYGSITIAKAIEFTTEYYSPNGQHSNGGNPVDEATAPPPPVWESPQAFDSVPVPEFPVDALPVDVADYVSQEAEAKQVPIDLPGCLVIGALAAAAGGKCNVIINADWQEPVNTYVVSVLPSGERKSPLFRSVLKPLEDGEKELVTEQAPEILKAKTEKDILEQRWKNAKTEAAKAKDDARTNTEVEARDYAEQLAGFVVPEAPRLLADDATPEAVARLLAEQNGRLAIASTEGGIFDIVGGRYSEGTPNLDVYLKAYSADTVRVDRQSRPPQFVSKPALTVILTVQPDVVADLAEKKAFRGRGFLARWLYSLPKSRVGYRDIDAPSVQEEAHQLWDSMIRKILRIPTPDEKHIPGIRLSAEAHVTFREFRQEVEVELRPGEKLDDLADWGNKLSGNVARLAGLLHIAGWALNSVYCVNSVYAPGPWESEIDQETMEAAVNLGRYFEGHAKAAFALMGSDGKLAIAKKIWAVIEKYKLEDFTVRELWQKVRRRFGDVSELEQVLNVLEELGYIRKIDAPKREGAGRFPSPAFLVNPLPRTQNPQNTQNKAQEPSFDAVEF